MSQYLGNELISGAEQFVGDNRNIGQIIPSTIPLTDAGLHLLDGSLILGGGIYDGFVDYIADLYYSSSGSSEIRTNPIMTSNTTPYGTASYTGTLYSTSQPFAMLAGSTSSTAWATSNGSVTYAFDVAQQPLAGTYRFYFKYGSYDASGRSLNNVVITVTYEDNTTSTINVGNLTGTIHAIDSYYVTSEFTTSKKIKSFTLSHSGSSVSITTMNIGNFQLQRMVSNYFCQEYQWQSSVSTYGSCGKFVYDSVNNTVRLPKITGKIEGTTDATALGDLAPLLVKLPNITGQFGARGMEYTNVISNGAFYIAGAHDVASGSGATGVYFGFDASRSSSVYSGNGSDTTIHEQAIKVLYYIVIATSTKTDIQVDIDEIATDLNGKADVDLTNCTDVANIKMAHNAMPSNTYINLTLGASGSTYTAPADGYVYFSTTTGGYVNVGVEGLPHVTNGSNGQWLHVQVPVAKGQSYNISYSFNSVQYFRFYYAVGSESEAS